jgi:hypothetical protein
MDRLDALRIKYARAEEHSAAWSRALDKWVDAVPYGVRGEAHPSGWFVIRFVARELPARGTVARLRGHDLQSPGHP